MPPEPVLKRDNEFPMPTNDVAPISTGPRRTAVRSESRESIIAADITIEGKIDGAGHVRLAGRFKGDVHIQGDLTVEAGAKLTGSVRANSVAIGGEVEGNIESAMRVELLETGILNGDLKAGTLTVAAGSRMRTVSRVTARARSSRRWMRASPRSQPTRLRKPRRAGRPRSARR